MTHTLPALCVSVSLPKTVILPILAIILSIYYLHLGSQFKFPLEKSFFYILNSRLGVSYHFLLTAIGYSSYILPLITF